MVNPVNGLAGRKGERCDGTFKGRHFTSEVILSTPHWYLAFPVNYRVLATMLLDRGIAVDHTTMFRRGSGFCCQAGTAGRAAPAAVHSLGQTINFLLLARRDAGTAKRFFRKALAYPYTVNSRTSTTEETQSTRVWSQR